MKECTCWHLYELMKRFVEGKSKRGIGTLLKESIENFWFILSCWKLRIGTQILPGGKILCQDGP